MHAAPFRSRSRFLSAIATLAVLAPASAAVADSGVKCHNSDSYGSTCIALTGDGLNLKDVQAWFVPPNRDYLSHRRWAFELTKYPCNPIGKPLSECTFTRHWVSRTRRGNPPKNSSFCEILAPQGVGVQQCQDFGVAYADANFGDWARFPRLPHQFRRGFWLCQTLVVRVNRRWHRNGAPGTPGERGCAEVHD